ncbi:hypothetical protein KKB18_04060, partial [bacterium]|nr:hypothetical protein [bacterium]
DPSNPNGRTTFWVNDINNPGTLTITLLDYNDMGIGGEWIIVKAAFPGSTSNVFDGVKFDSPDTPVKIQTDSTGHASIKFYSQKAGQTVFVATVDDTVEGHITYVGQELEPAVSSTVSFISADEPCEFTAEFIDEDGANYVSDPDESPHQTDTANFTLSQFDYDTSDAETGNIVRKPVANSEIIIQVLEGTTTKPFGSATFEPALGEGNVIVTNADGEASAHFYVTDPGSLRIRGTLKDTTGLTCFNQNISYADTQVITYSNPSDACTLDLVIKDVSDKSTDTILSGAPAYAEVTVRCNYKPLEGAVINFSITPDGAIFDKTKSSSCNETTNADGKASVLFYTKTTDKKDTFTIEAKIVDVPPGDCKDICIGLSDSDWVQFTGELYKVELAFESNDPIDPLFHVLGDGKHPIYVVVTTTVAGSPQSATVDLSFSKGNACFNNGQDTYKVVTDKTTGQAKVPAYALHITSFDNPVDDNFDVTAVMTIGGYTYSDVATFTARGIYISEFFTDDNLVRSDSDWGTKLNVKVVDTTQRVVGGVLVGGRIGTETRDEGGGFYPDPSGNPVKEASWYTDDTGIATHSIYGFCCGYPSGLSPIITVWISTTDSQYRCSEGSVQGRTAANLVTWLPGPGCYTAETIAYPANPETGEGEVCHFVREGAGGGLPGQGTTENDQCFGTLELNIYQVFDCDMVGQIPEQINDFTVEFQASGNLLLGLTDNSITEKIIEKPGSSLGYVVYVDIANDSGNAKGKIAWKVKELYNKGNTHSFNFSGDFCLKIIIVDGSKTLKVGDSITLQATGGCGDSWSWSPGEEVGIEFTYVATEEDAGKEEGVIITVTDNKGDSASVKVWVTLEATPTESGSPTATPAQSRAPKDPSRSSTPAPGK